MKIKLILTLLLLVSSCTEGIKHAPLQSEDIIVALGDSLTTGVGADASLSYPAQLQQLLLQKVINAGISGEESTGTLKRINRILTENRPALVLLCIGGNDFLRKQSKQQLKKNLNSLIITIQNSGADVVLIAVPEPSIFLSPSDIYAELAEQHNILLVEDVLSDLLSKSRYKSDGIHLNAQGYKILAEEILLALIESGLVVT